MEAARGVFEVNVFGVLAIVQEVVGGEEGMARRGEGLVINVGSVVVSGLSRLSIKENNECTVLR